MTKLSSFAVALAVAAIVSVEAFTSPSLQKMTAFSREVRLFEDKTDAAANTEAVFMPPSDDDVDEDMMFEKAEALGRGSSKAKRGKRKSGSDSGKVVNTKAAVSLAPEEIFYEGPPAITETIAPTISILTVVGIIPAAAAWARQAWVRYKITTRRIRVTSGINGKDMAEIVYPDIVELRTAKRLFGDGDLVAFLRDGAKFEMRNIPNFDEAMEFILKNVDPEVAKQYKEKGDVTRPAQ